MRKYPVRFLPAVLLAGLLLSAGCSDSGDRPYLGQHLLQFEEFQSIPTKGARDWRFFTIGNDSFLAVANNFNGQTPNIDSKIYRWDGTKFVEFQAIPTNWATQWEFFTIADDSFLAVANNNMGGGVFDIDSKIYRWDGTKFAEFQAIPTHGASGWKFFTIGGDCYLAVANNRSGTANFIIDSMIYKWDGEKFVEFQATTTNGALRWEFFTIEGDSFLAVANYSTDFTTNFNIDSKIYKWDGSKFDEFQSIPTSGAHDWKFFTIESVPYLTVANLHSGPYRTGLEIDSKIYRWDGAKFVEFQSIPTSGAVGWGFASSGPDSFLAVANWKNDAGSYLVDSKIYSWDGSRFVEFQSLPTNGASDCEFFTIGSDLYLAVANVGGGAAGPNTESKIYRQKRRLF